MEVPGNLRYAPTHEWIAVEGNLVTIGITEFAVEQLSDLVFIELPKVGESLTQGDPFGEIESTKTVSDLNTPAGGEVVEVNTEVIEDLDLIKDSPYNSGWLIRIRVDDVSKIGDLLGPQDYEKLLETEREHG